MNPKATPESALLAARDPALDNSSDDWLEFELTNVTFFHPDEPSQPVSLLQASLNNPLTLVGQLEPLPKDQAHLLLQNTTRRAPLIEISDVRLFSYGQYEIGDVGLWAAGRAGWFLLKPSRAYKEVWNRMVEAVKVLYFVADAYKEKRKTGKGKSATVMPDYSPRELFEKYATEVLDVPRDTPDAAGEAANKIYEHLDFLLASMIAGKEGLSWSKTPIYKHLLKRFPAEYAAVRERMTKQPTRRAASSSAPSISSETSSMKKRRGRPPNKATDVISIGSSSANSTTAIDLPSRPEPVKAVSTAAQPKQPRANSRIAIEQAVYSTTPEVTAAETPEKESDEESYAKAMKGRSSLRPRPSKANKGASRGGKSRVAAVEDEEMDIQSSPITSKRKHDGQDEIPRAKRHNNRQDDVDEGIDMPSSPSSNEVSDDALSPDDTTAGAAPHDDDNDHNHLSLKSAARLNHVPDPVQEDTWVCALDGCTHKVYTASLPESQRLIREHYALHAYDDDDRVKMVKMLQHPSLPVNHLMERVRLQAKMEGFPGSRTGVGGPNDHNRFPAMSVLKY